MPYSTFDPLARARRHAIVCDRPAPDFFSGALLGNGGLGAVVTTRPDAVAIHFGHNNVWDIRLAERNQDKIGTFQEVFDRVQALPDGTRAIADDPWFAQYLVLTRESYAQPYPRPFPCGTLVLGFDRRRAELLGHRLDIATGLLKVDFLVNGAPAMLELFADMAADRLWLRMLDAAGKPIGLPFNRVRLIPDPDTPKDMPAPEPAIAASANTLSFSQVLPYREPVEGAPAPAHPKDRAMRLSVRLRNGLERRTRITWQGQPTTMGDLERGLLPADEFVACVQIDEGLATGVLAEAADLPEPSQAAFAAAAEATGQSWAGYWGRSGVALDDPFLEETWYRNLYFLNCSVRAGCTCPGLFANWSYRQIGSAWHSDYHLNYNTQQPFWATFSSNHVDKHLPYVEMVHSLRPVARNWAQGYYGLRGAYFPHTAYPVEMSVMPYPVPTWGWEICETPWTVQSLWWHYLYTMDTAFLRERAFAPLKEAVLFLVDYARRPDARGERWGDDRYHIFPSVPPELYGLQPKFKFNYDCLADLTLTRFVCNAYLAACRVLGVEADETGLMQQVRDVLEHLAANPTAPSPHGEVYVSVPGESAETVYNVPVSLMTVFPGEEHGLHSSPAEYELAANTYRRQQNEGGNELVFLNLQGARLGLLDLERFGRQVRYCQLPNGVCTDLALQVHGRYNDLMPFDFMARMGIWFENFGLPAVIDECLLQSYTGTLRLFPNWPGEVRAEFRTLRAVGAFLVSAAWADGRVQWVEVTSEAGGTLRLLNPWPAGARCLRGNGEAILHGDILETETQTGETIRFLPA